MSYINDDKIRPRYAVRGAAAFGLTTVLVFGLSAWYAGTSGGSQTDYLLVLGPLCGIIGGFAYRRAIGLPVVLALSFGFIGSMFLLQDARSTLFIDVVYTGVVSAFVFWIAGGCAALALPADFRFDGAKAFAVPGGLAGAAFQFFYGPAHSAFDLGAGSWWGQSPWEHLVLWLIAGVGGGWLFGAELDRLCQTSEPNTQLPGRNGWAVASIACGVLGLATGAIYFSRYRLPLGLLDGVSPASGAADWLWSWGVVVGLFGAIALIQTFTRAVKPLGRVWAVVGIVLAVVLVIGSVRVLADPWKSGFNTGFASRILVEHSDSGDPEYANAVYTGNLILAQAALDNDDLANARRHLLDAAATPGVRRIEDSGPDMTAARALLQRGERDTVLEYLRRCHDLWPKGAPLLSRWETIIRGGRQPNFNNRTIPPPEGSPPAREVGQP